MPTACSSPSLISTPTDSPRDRPATWLFLFAHPDDEFGVFPEIEEGVRAGRRMVVAVMAFGIGCIGLGLSTSSWVSIVLMAVTGYGLMTQIVGTNTMVQTLVEDDKRGRVMSFYTIALLGSAPIGSLISGTLAARIGVEATLALSGAGCTLAAVWFHRRLRTIRAAVRARYAELGIAAPGTG